MDDQSHAESLPPPQLLSHRSQESTGTRRLVGVPHGRRLEVGARLESVGRLYPRGDEGEGRRGNLRGVQAVGPAAARHHLPRRGGGDGEIDGPRITLAVRVASHSCWLSFRHLPRLLLLLLLLGVLAQKGRSSRIVNSAKYRYAPICACA